MMKRIATIAIAAAMMSSPVMAQEVQPVEPVTGGQGLGTLGTTQALTIIAGVIVVGAIIASSDDSSGATSTTN